MYLLFKSISAASLILLSVFCGIYLLPPAGAAILFGTLVLVYVAIAVKEEMR